jgi:hypothetical protein
MSEAVIAASSPGMGSVMKLLRQKTAPPERIEAITALSELFTRKIAAKTGTVRQLA